MKVYQGYKVEGLSKPLRYRASLSTVVCNDFQLLSRYFPPLYLCLICFLNVSLSRTVNISPMIRKSSLNCKASGSKILQYFWRELHGYIISYLIILIMIMGQEQNLDDGSLINVAKFESCRNNYNYAIYCLAASCIPHIRWNLSGNGVCKRKIFNEV